MSTPTPSRSWIALGSLDTMNPALPDPFGPSDSGPDADDVGEFQQGSPLSRWALARYLVGRAIGESVGWTLLILAGVLLALAALVQWGAHLTFLTVILVLLAIGVLVLRSGLRAILRRLTAARDFGPIEGRLRSLVSDTRGDVYRELRRLGLPSHTLTLPLLAVRLAGRRRPETLRRLRGFELGRAVPRVRLDELHFLVRSAVGRTGTGPR
jgi:hypothetical protein